MGWKRWGIGHKLCACRIARNGMMLSMKNFPMFDILDDFLPPEHRALLPDFNDVQALPRLFEDSTNRLWEVRWLRDGQPQEGVLKLCRQTDLKDSSFWQAMRQLFGVSYPLQMADFQTLYRQLSIWSPLQVPKLFLAADDPALARGWLLTEKLEGRSLSVQPESTAIAEDLARHVGQLHQQRSPYYGEWHTPKGKAVDWPLAVCNTVADLAAQTQQDIRDFEPALQRFVQEGGALSAGFVPIMPDLRWDQFLHKEGRLSALVDLDALVWGPVELEWVLLEYLLNAEQAEAFARVYQTYRPLPELTQVRTVYRLLLFFMQVLGEGALARWMSAPERF